jgi:NitT/TauT family transport system permease protein
MMLRTRIGQASADHERLLLGSFAMILFLIAWEGIARGWWADLLAPVLGVHADVLRARPIFLPAPTAIAQVVWTLYVGTGEIWPDLALSGLEIVVGLALAMGVGIPLGLLAGRFRYLSFVLKPFMMGLNATPQVAFLPLLVLWTGTGVWTRVLIVFLLAVLPILISTHAAVRTVDPRLLRVARSFSSSELHTFKTVIVPSAMPFILAGVRLAIGRSMIGIVVGELYGSGTGVGIMINKAGAMFETSKVFAGILTIVVASLILTELIRRIEMRMEGWRASLEERTA